MSSGAKFLDGVEGSDPQQILLQCPYEAFGDAIAFGFSDEGRRGFDAEAFDLGWKSRTCSWSHGHDAASTRAPRLGDSAEANDAPLPDGLQRFEAIGRLRGMDADDFRVGVLYRNKDIGAAFRDGDGLVHISPHIS